MYFNVPAILIAPSDDLVDWTPLAASSGRLVKVLSPRSGYFDSWLVEAGPPALLTAHGILLLYNAGNSGEFGDPTLPARVYTGGQALYDSRNPLKLIEIGRASCRETHAVEAGDARGTRTQPHQVVRRLHS